MANIEDDVCPECGSDVELSTANGSTVVFCRNTDCDWSFGFDGKGQPGCTKSGRLTPDRGESHYWWVSENGNAIRYLGKFADEAAAEALLEEIETVEHSLQGYRLLTDLCVELPPLHTCNIEISDRKLKLRSAV